MLRTNLEPTRLKCAFTIFLAVYNKRTNGGDLAFHHEDDSAVLVIEIDTQGGYSWLWIFGSIPMAQM